MDLFSLVWVTPNKYGARVYTAPSVSESLSLQFRNFSYKLVACLLLLTKTKFDPNISYTDRGF